MAMQMGTTQSHRCGAVAIALSDKADKTHQWTPGGRLGSGQQDSTELCVSVSYTKSQGQGQVLSC